VGTAEAVDESSGSGAPLMPEAVELGGVPFRERKRRGGGGGASSAALGGRGKGCGRGRAREEGRRRGRAARPWGRSAGGRGRPRQVGPTCR
jgi:hypothetical protein